MQEDLLDKEARTEESNADDEQYFFDALDGHDYFFGVVEEEIKSSETMSYSLLSALTTSENKDSGKIGGRVVGGDDALKPIPWQAGF